MKKFSIKTLVFIIVTFSVIGAVALGMKFLNRKSADDSYPLKYEKEITAAAEKYKRGVMIPDQTSQTKEEDANGIG